MNARGELPVRFWDKVEKGPHCWTWTGGTSRGYGKFKHAGKMASAHRIAYEYLVAAIPTGMQIDHTCHIRSCVNPNHLRVVTAKQNCENVLGAQSNSSSGYLGVTWHKQTRKWWARVTHNGESLDLGYFDDPKEAGAAAAAKRLELFTHNDWDRTAA